MSAFSWILNDYMALGLWFLKLKKEKKKKKEKKIDPTYAKLLKCKFVDCLE